MLRTTTEIFIAACAALGFFVLLWLVGLFPQESGVAAVIAGLAAGTGYAVGRLRADRKTTEVTEPR